MKIWNRIMHENLGVAPGERFMILCDRARPFPEHADVVIGPSTGGHGREPHPDVWRAAFGTSAIAFLELQGIFDRIMSKTATPDDTVILDKWALDAAMLAPNAILAVTHFSTSHTAFRRLLCRTGARYASMPLFEEDLLRKDGPLDVDQTALATRTRTLAENLRTARRIHITTPIGTDLHLDVEGRTFLPDDGDLRAPGAFGNLPAGEVYIAPLEGTAEGRIALKPNVILTIEKGRIVSIDGPSVLDALFKEHPEYFFLAELGIGTNDRASRVDNVLEAEKILGTVHIAFGDNSSFGGTQQIPYHADHVLFDPTVVVDGTTLALR